jgi:biotin transporter BioY
MVGILITFVISYIIAYLMRSEAEKENTFRDAIIITVISLVIAHLLGDNIL